MREREKVIGIIVIIIGMIYIVEPWYKMWCNEEINIRIGERRNTERLREEKKTKGIRVGIRPRKGEGIGIKTGIREIKIREGETGIVSIKVINYGKKRWYGYTTISIEPIRAGIYIRKIQCFCYTGIRIERREIETWPIWIYVEKGIRKDTNISRKRVEIRYKINRRKKSEQSAL